MTLDLGTLTSKVRAYKVVLNNTIEYREAWNAVLKEKIKSTLENIVTETGLEAEVKIQDKIENLESVVLDLGRTSSGISESIEDSGIMRTMVKSNGSLIYQQLFNGKVMVMIVSPNIEGYGQEKPPKTIEILRPDELKKAFILRHMEALLKDITDWEDFDDDEPVKASIGFQPIGFNNNIIEEPLN